jgi:uncharacterized membrane protein YidH (DUF202 family)
MKSIGVVLVVLGIAALVYGGFGYDRERTVLDLGQIRATATEHKTLALPPIVGVLVILGGLAMVFLPLRRTT